MLDVTPELKVQFHREDRIDEIKAELGVLATHEGDDPLSELDKVWTYT